MYSSFPVRYWDGAILLREQDIAVPRGGLFGHSRSYYQKPSGGTNGLNGYNWYIRELPFLVASGTSIAIIFDPNNPYWFDLISGSYVARHGTLDVSLSHSGSTFTFTRTTGGRVETVVFYDFTSLTMPGEFQSYTDAAGIQTTITSQSAGLITELQRSYTVGGSTIIESLQYTYGPGIQSDKIETLTFRKSSNGGSTWTYIKQFFYNYYGSSDTNGSTNDLHTAEEYNYNGTGWDMVAVTYYRYYKAGDAKGNSHCLKLRCGPEAFRRIHNAGINIDTASDATLQPYADQYFEYDTSANAVTKEVSAVCDSCPGGGTTSDTFVYSSNPNTPPAGYNAWAQKAVQTLPNSAQIIVYTNAFSQPMLKVYIDPNGTDRWFTFYLYDSNGRMIWEAQPSAINVPASLSTLEQYNDLMHLVSGSYQYLNNSAGLIKVTDYYASTGSGGVEGYVQYDKLRQGQSGSDVLVRSYTYTSNTVGSETVNLPASVVDYPDAANPATTITTTFSYSFYSGTNQIQERTTTLPTVGSGQNGSGLSVTIVEEYDTYGNLTQVTDERLTVNQYVYDVVFGVKTQQTLNYVSPPTGAAGENLVSDFSYDDFGRLIQVLGPSHEVDLAGTATTVRTATWYVYIQSSPVSGVWGLDEDRVGMGYATGSSPSYTYALVNPVNLSQKDKNGRLVNRITSKRTSGSGKLSSGDTFVQTDWKSWNSTQYDDQGHTISGRVYHLIPSSGDGSITTNYGQTDYGYDALERQNKVKAPGGTITRTVWTSPQRVASVWVGTDDTGATDSNPAGSGSPNNMVQVTGNQYDGGSAGGDGNVTQVTHYAGASDTRVTSYGYDWRDRRTSEDGEVDYYAEYTYDNLGRVTRVDRKDTSSSGNLIGRNDTAYDDRGRVYQRITYAVASGTPGNAVTENTWYDAGQNVIKRIAAGAGIVSTKNEYNGMGWMTTSYSGYNTINNYSTATSPSGDTITEQVEITYDDAGNVLSHASYQRLNDATGTGLLSAGSQPKARVSYAASWFDGIDRPISSANYGAISSFTRPTTSPSRSDTVLVTTTSYDDAGRAYSTIDPAGIETQTTFDAAGRKTDTLEAYGTADERETQFTYTLDNLIATLVAINSSTGNQTTTYTYGTTLTESGVARNDLLRYIDYPDSVSGSDRVAITYNRQEEETTRTDQRGTVRSFDYDKLGRLTQDRVPTVGTNTDNVVLRIGRTYEVRGMVEKITSYDNATVGSGTVLNEVKLTYNDFGQLITEEQAHGGATGSSPSFQYAHADGSSNSNQIRPTSLTYPDSRVIDTNYGISAGMNDYLNRIEALKDGSTALATYTYLGGSTVIVIDYAQPQVKLDLWGGTSGSFDGFDRFGRIIDQRWLKYSGTPTDLDRYKYGYDRDSNRQWKQNVVSGSLGTPVPLDEYYSYDNLNRLTAMQRGTLTGSPPSGISGIPVKEEDWTLDPTGNWSEYIQKTSGTADLDQTRTANKLNEITGISESTGPSWVDPAYDEAGNTTTFPQGDDPTQSYIALCDAWNRMVYVKDGSNFVAKYKYDGRMRRIIQESYTAGVLSETRHFYFTNDWQDIEERVGSSSSADLQYVWGIRYVDELVCRDDATPRRLYAMQDANFNLTGIVDSSGMVAERYLFTPYGSRTIMTSVWNPLSSTAYEWLIGHQGLYHNNGLGTLYNRARMLNTIIGAFLQRDPVPYIDTMNLFEYESSGPMSVVDWAGLQAVAAPPTAPPTQQCPVNPVISNYNAQVNSNYRANCDPTGQAAQVQWLSSLLPGGPRHGPIFIQTPPYLWTIPPGYKLVKAPIMYDPNCNGVVFDSPWQLVPISGGTPISSPTPPPRLYTPPPTQKEKDDAWFCRCATWLDEDKIEPELIKRKQPVCVKCKRRGPVVPGCPDFLYGRGDNKKKAMHDAQHPSAPLPPECYKNASYGHCDIIPCDKMQFYSVP